jgi:nucleotide-binding universal stress UspA family protein
MQELFPEIEDPEDLSSVIKQELEEKISSAFKNFESTQLVLDEGDPTNAIIKQIKKQNPDLLVLGKKEKFKGEGILSKKIVRYVPGSVLFVPESSRYQLHQILTPFNFNDHSAAAIRFSEDLANRTDANVLLQHVYDYPAQFFPFLPSNEFEEKMSKQLKEKFDEFKKEKGFTEDTEVVFTLNKQDRIQNKIYDQSIQVQADLIVVGSKSKRTMASFLHEDLSDKIVNYGFGVPLLVYKDKSKNKGMLDSLLGS